MKTEILTTSIILLFCGACTTSPTGRHELHLVSDSQMSEMGTQAWQQVLAKYPKSTCSADIKLVNDVARRIIDASPMARDKWEVVLFDSKDVNAFALPGGHIGVFSGLLAVAQNEAGLATVLAHETGHVLAKHGDERASQELAAQGALAIASTALGDSQFHDALMGALGLGTQVGVLLPFSRAEESEADQIGLNLMAKAGYDPNEALTFWDRMIKASKGEPPAFLSDHPASTDRVVALKKLLPAAQQEYAKAPTHLGVGGRVPAGG
ncbi:MAG: M48 family metallopeptidase [Deltaproteobacteria bacterium]|nr:M48 family metallopeptidase [Deltaproteobacteria bacterium]